MQSPSWAANWFAASQEIPRISRNPKVHYRTHKRPPPVSILGQPNPETVHKWIISYIRTTELKTLVKCLWKLNVNGRENQVEEVWQLEEEGKK